MRGEGIVPVMEVGNNNGNGGFSGYGNGDWAWIIVLFLIFGYGRNGFGNGFGGNGGVGENYILASDFATIQRQLSDGFGDLTAQSRYIQNGLCDGFYAMNTSLLNGFAGVNQSIVNNGYETRNAIQGVSSQLANCCCDIRQQISDCCCTTQRSIDNVNFNLSQIGCGITNTINNATRDLIDNQNANYRALHDEIIANRIEDKNAQITAQQNEINALRLKASQEAQNAYLINQLKPCPEPSYIVPNPNCCYNYAVTGFGYGNGCNGCGCN